MNICGLGHHAECWGYTEVSKTIPGAKASGIDGY